MTAFGRSDVEWTRGGLARIVALRGDTVVMVSTAPSPPGSRLEGTLTDEPRERVRIKVHVCRSGDDGTFSIEGRALDLRRELRARLEAMASAGPVPSDSSDGGGGVVPSS